MAVPQPQRRSDVTVGALIFIAVVLAGFALKYTSPVTAPLAFAFFAALVLYPVRVAVARRMPRRLRWVGVLAAVLLLVLALGLLGGAVALAIAELVRELPRHTDTLGGAVVDPIRQWAERIGLTTGRGDPELAKDAARGGAVAVKALSGALGFVVLSVFFAVLMLAEVGQWREKLSRVLRREWTSRVLDAATASASGVRMYLLAVTVVGLATAILEGAFLALMGLDLVLVFALLFFLLNYVPYVGSIVAAVPPILFALATQGLRRGFLVALGILVIEQIMGHLVAPVVEGRGARLSPVVVLAAVTMWGWAWGVVGALLAVPLTVAIMMLCARIPGLEPVAVFLGEPEGP